MANIVHGPGSGGTHPRIARLLLLTVITALVVGTCGSPNPTPAPSSTAQTQASTSPSTAPTLAPGATPTPAPNPTPTPTERPTGSWADVALPSLKPAASLTPTHHGEAGVALDTTFRFTSLDGTPVGTLADRLEVTPTITLSRHATTNRTVTLTPTAALSPGVTYRFALRRTDGTIAGAWTIKATSPLRVVGTLPGDESTDVPRNTGIEFSFDQSGVTASAVRDAFTISPKVTGRFEAHGKIVAFVPAKPLKSMTIYTVTLRKGVPLPGTGQKLEEDVVFRFETKGTGANGARIHIPGAMVDSAVAQRPTIALYFGLNEDEKAPSTLPMTIHRLAGLSAAMEAYGRLDADLEWAESTGAPISTKGLPLVLEGTVKVHRILSEYSVLDTWIQVPQTLPAGWYVATLTFNGRRMQTLLQVTDLAVYAMVTRTESAIWVNSLTGGGPVANATVAVAGKSVGRTDANGLRVVTTPAALTKGSGNVRERFVVVHDGDGRVVFIPIVGSAYCEACTAIGDVADTGSDAWWNVMATDRQSLRQTDQVNVWGMVRARSDGAVPKGLEVRLTPYSDWTGTSLPIVTAHPTPAPSGMFTATLAFKDLPTGYYAIELLASGHQLGSTEVRIGPIVKPSWHLDLTSGKRAVISGAKVDITAAASFFDGTPVAGVDLALTTNAEDEEDPTPTIKVRTGTDGDATGQVAIVLPTNEYDDSQWDWQTVDAAPTLPEEAAITGQTWVAVFRSTALLDAEATLSGTQLTVTGAVHDVDFARMATVTPGDWSADPTGGPRANATVSLKIVERIPTRTRIGTDYDFITKTTSPVYRYGERSVPLGTRTATTAADGTFRLSMSVTGGDRSYEITARYTDEAGRTIRTQRDASSPEPADENRSVQLVAPGATGEDGVAYAPGETVSLEAMGGHPVPATDHYLFTVTHLGLRSATVQDGPSFSIGFHESWIPNATVRAVRFNGTTYEPSDDYGANLRLTDRILQVSLAADAARYAPGGTARLTVRTLDASGKPVPASVVIRVVDEKIYAIDGAYDVDLLGELYSSVSDGLIGISWSHGEPAMLDGFGDTTGGGGDERSDFRDWLLFKQVTTGTDGRATVSVDLSDDLTSWRVSAAALDTSYRAGTQVMNLPVGLPFFAEATLAQGYLVGDQPVLRVRGYGSALRAGDPVSFTVSAPTLGLTGSATAPAFTAASIDLPKLTAGDHRIRIAASTGTGANRHDDVLIRTIHVVDSRSVQAKTASGLLVAGFRLRGGTNGTTTVVLSDGGRGRALPILLDLLGTDTGRADQALASEVARAVLQDTFDLPEAVTSAEPADLSVFQHEAGIALLPYASGDLELTALAALAKDPRLEPARLAEVFDAIRSEPRETRERRIVALTGMAALGQADVSEVRTAAKGSKLTVVERSWLAVAAWAAGDETLAATLERGVLASNGQRLGPWVRVKDGGTETTATTTALLAIAASGIGDPLAADMDAFIADNPPRDTLLVLQRAIAARSWAERTPGQAAVATVRVDGTTRRIEISPSEPTVITLTPAQLATATISPVSGKVIVTSTWEGPLDTASLHPVGIERFTRSVSPSGTVPVDGLVTVTFKVGLASSADKGCWQVTDLVPSGLAPVWGRYSGYDEEDGSWPIDSTTISPWRIQGQRVDFCVSRDPKHPVQTLRYIARVVSPGTYGWEPSVIQSSIVLEHGKALPASTLVIAR